MIDWIDCLGRTWGAYMREEPYATPTSLWTRHSLINVNGITSDGTFWNNKPYKYPRHQIPIKSKSRDQLRFHRAWKSLKGGRQDFIWLHYVSHAKQAAKIEFLRLNDDAYFESLHECHELMETHIVERGL